MWFISYRKQETSLPHRTSEQPWGPSGLLFSRCCGSFSALKQLMHEPDHSPLFSANVTHQCSCNCVSPVCLHGVHRGIFTFYHCLRGMASVSMCNSVTQKMRTV